jgi:pyroglutamyl-peptidase
LLFASWKKILLFHLAKIKHCFFTVYHVFTKISSANYFRTPIAFGSREKSPCIFSKKVVKWGCKKMREDIFGGMMRLLITGFAPFGGEEINPSWEAVRALPERILEYELTKLRLPVVFGEAAKIAIAEAEKIRADVVLCIGQAGGRAEVCPELVGINLKNATIPDNGGNQPKDEPIAEGGDAAYFSTLPVRKIADAISAAGIPSRLSYSAGAYVCNELLYSLLRHFDGGENAKENGGEKVQNAGENAKENGGEKGQNAGENAKENGREDRQNIGENGGEDRQNAEKSTREKCNENGGEKGRKVRVGFIHVPYIPEQGKTPSMSLDDIKNALKIAIENLDI